MLEAVKKALRITTRAYDDELQRLISAGILDLDIAGISCDSPSTDPLVQRAVITYVRCHFGTPPDYDRMKAAYDEMKAQLQTATGYTEWGDEDDET